MNNLVMLLAAVLTFIAMIALPALAVYGLAEFGEYLWNNISSLLPSVSVTY